jgi:hypothetical protein
MPDTKKDTGFTVTDRRLFTTDGDLRSDLGEDREEKAESKPASPELAAGPEPAPSPASDSRIPPPPTAADQKASDEAYQKSSKDLDARVELSGHSAKEFEMTFERFMASLYMSAMMQLGMMHEEGGQPRIDLIGARQTIDTLALLQDKTKNNLTATEENFLQNCLYELRMAYVEVTNALSRAPKNPEAAAGSKTR